MLKFTHFEGLDNRWKQLFILVPYYALEQGAITQCRQIKDQIDHMTPKPDSRGIFMHLLVNNFIAQSK